jgi:hypothetical protein
VHDPFIQVLAVIHEMNLLKIGDISIDGTTMNVNASKLLSRKHACKLEEQPTAEVREVTEAAEKGDKEDLPDELSVPCGIARREERLKKIRATKKTIEQRTQYRYQQEKPDYEIKCRPGSRTTKRSAGKRPAESRYRRSKAFGARTMGVLRDYGQWMRPLSH